MDLIKTLLLCILCSASASAQTSARAYFKACLNFKDQWNKYYEEISHEPSHPLNLNSVRKVPKFKPCR